MKKTSTVAITRNRLSYLKKINGNISCRGLATELHNKGVNVSYATISSIENGDANPTWDTLVALSNYFGVTVDYLMGRDEVLKKYAEKDIEKIEKESISTDKKNEIDEYINHLVELRIKEFEKNINSKIKESE